MKNTYDEILAKFHEVSEDEKITDGWDAFIDVWEWIKAKDTEKSEAAQSELAPKCQ